MMASCAVPHGRVEGQFSNWCFSPAKRCLDLICATGLLLATAPVLVIAAMAVRLSSSGPVIFRHTRLGKDGREIAVFKLRTMRCGQTGPAVTRSGDSRITPVGRFLRNTKVDELPQVFNVLRGEMSMVGPRPDAANYLSRLSAEERQILLLRPGITSSTTLSLRNEEELLASLPEPEIESFYCSILLPHKVGLEIEYARRATLRTDLAVLFRTAGAIILPMRKHTALSEVRR